MKSMQQNIRTGTSNIMVPGNRSSFPPPYDLKSRLHYYAHHFSTIEINQTFYKLPKPATFGRWAAEAGDDFQFSIKLSKDITHNKKLNAKLDIIDGFLHSANGLGDKRGCLLLQFPGRITLEYFDEVEAILAKTIAADKYRHWKIAVELRDASWHTGETYELLNMYQATLVIQDMFRCEVMEHFTKAPFVYMRFHGPQGDYRGSYPHALLQQKARQICNWAKQGKEVYVYFNNSIGKAFENACLLMKMMQKITG